MRLENLRGRAFEPVEFVIGDRLSAMNWARALEIDDPVLRSGAAARAAGWDARPVPPVLYAFFLTLPEPVLIEELGFTWGRTLAAAIEVEAGRILTEEDFVRGGSFVDEAYEQPGRDGATRQFLRLRTDFWDGANCLVNRWRVLFIERVDRRPSEALGGEPGPGPSFAERHPLAEPASPPPRVPEDGKLPNRTIGPLDRLAFARMSVALDDPNLVHLDERVAARAGFPGVIGSGGFVLGALYEQVRSWAGTDRVARIDMRQLVPFSDGTILTTSARILEERKESGRNLLDCEVQAVDRAGTLVGTGTVSVVSS